MVKRIASFEAVGFVLLVACGAVCQNAGESLPDAPSAVVAAQTERFNAPVEEGGSPLNVGSTSVGSTSVGSTSVGSTSGGAMGVAARPIRQDAVLIFDRSASRHKDLDAVFRKYLSSSSAKPQPNSKSGASVMGRATHAAARTVVTRNDSGKGRLNTSYLLRTLSAVAKDSAATPYWRRHLTNTVSDFGSTVGSDAGMNLWHEFGPGIARLLRNHTPVLISRIEGRIGRG